MDMKTTTETAKATETQIDRAKFLDNFLTHLCDNAAEFPKGHPLRKVRIQTILAVADRLDEETGR
jgi:hypothetical protein